MSNRLSNNGFNPSDAITRKTLNKGFELVKGVKVNRAIRRCAKQALKND